MLGRVQTGRRRQARRLFPPDARLPHQRRHFGDRRARNDTALLRRAGDGLCATGGKALAPGVDALCPIAFLPGNATSSNAAGLRASTKVHVSATTGLWRNEAAMSGSEWKLPLSFFGPAAQADPGPTSSLLRTGHPSAHRSFAQTPWMKSFQRECVPRNWFLAGFSVEKFNSTLCTVFQI